MQKRLLLFNMQHCINRRKYVERTIINTKSFERTMIVEQKRSQNSEEIEWNDSPVPKKPFLERYNRFLTIWMIAMIVLIIVAIGVQIFL